MQIMTKWLCTLVLGLVATGLVSAPAYAQGVPLTCNDDLYQVRSGGSPASTALLRFPQAVLGSGGAAANVWGALRTPGTNAIGFRQQDGYIYGIETVAQVPQLYRLGSTTSVLVGTITTVAGQTPALTATFQPTAGTFDAQGRYYFAGQDTGGTNLSPSAIYRVDSFADISAAAGVQIGVAAVYPLSATLVNLGDFAFGPDGNLYGASGTTLAQIRLPATPGTAIVTTAAVSAVGGIGSAFFSNAGDLYVYDNGAAALRRVSFDFGTAFPGTLSVGAPVTINGAAPLPTTTSASDGASCLQPNADVSVALNLPAAIAPGATTTIPGALVCTNNGPSAAVNVSCTASSTTPNVTVTVGTCTPVSPAAALRATSGQNTITCPITIVTQEAAGGTNTTPTAVVIDGAVATTMSETNTANNTTSASTPVIDAIDDAAGTPVNGASGGVGVANVLGNDGLGAAVATVATVLPTQVSTTHPNVTLDPATGAINVAPGTPGGTYTVVYRICSRVLTTVCDTAQASVIVAAIADLAITKTNNATSVTSGGTTTYTIVATNNGPSPADGAVVRDTPAAGLTCTTATCTASGTSQCPAATGAALATALLSPGGVAIPLFSAGAANAISFTLDCAVQ